MPYKSYAALHEDISSGWVWIGGHDFPQRSIIKITNKKKSVYCEFLKIDENYLEKYNNGRTLKIENPSNTIIANEWYRTRLGIKKTNQDENITIQPANNLIGKLCASLQHPQLIVRISTKLGLLSFGLGLISLFN